jgi:hypothetical protein
MAVVVDISMTKGKRMNSSAESCRFSDAQIRQWREAAAKRREELFGVNAKRRMIPMGRSRKPAVYKETEDIGDTLGEVNPR